MANPPVSWCLVWCHEKGERPENAKVMQAMRDGAAALGASFVFVKKAITFFRWLQDKEELQYCLVTDWREAQPCIQALAGATLQVPSRTIVVCEGANQARRASDWARTVNPAFGPVVCVDKAAIPTDLLHGLIHASFAEAVPVAAPGPLTSAHRYPREWVPRGPEHQREFYSAPASANTSNSSGSVEALRAEAFLHSTSTSASSTRLRDQTDPCKPHEFYSHGPGLNAQLEQHGIPPGLSAYALVQALEPLSYAMPYSSQATTFAQSNNVFSQSPLFLGASAAHAQSRNPIDLVQYVCEDGSVKELLSL